MGRIWCGFTSHAVNLTDNLIMIGKLVLGEIWTGDLPIFNPDELTSTPSRQACIEVICLFVN